MSRTRFVITENYQLVGEGRLAVYLVKVAPGTLFINTVADEGDATATLFVSDDKRRRIERDFTGPTYIRASSPGWEVLIDDSALPVAVSLVGDEHEQGDLIQQRNQSPSLKTFSANESRLLGEILEELKEMVFHFRVITGEKYDNRKRK